MRASPNIEQVLRLAGLEINPVRHRATRAGKRINLSAKEFSLLTLLARRSNEVLSRTEIGSVAISAGW